MSNNNNPPELSPQTKEVFAEHGRRGGVIKRSYKEAGDLAVQQKLADLKYKQEQTRKLQIANEKEIGESLPLEFLVFLTKRIEVGMSARHQEIIAIVEELGIGGDLVARVKECLAKQRTDIMDAYEGIMKSMNSGEVISSIEQKIQRQENEKP